MPVIHLLITLVVVGVLLWLVNNYLAEYMDAKILRILNVVIVVVLILWLLSVFFGFGPIGSMRVPTLR